ncbi:hypothetical protein HNR65_003361 [Desulfosalsimonas propionicica]|uniref:Sulfotransferase family protein n=1 Tax=Desulfosalsimonas propionicica TaxID=332175 RepID=A0A7W0CC31_9BACT|nr:sulfotransferase [Desulfosalsimonas propionicica]MBA2883004.1 hypothetical protein [Desulfosalsimonas propionicica]
MNYTQSRKVLRENLGNIFREVKVALTPVPRPERWLFLVGCYNSGTTLLSKMLGRHPGISALPTEGHFITDQFVKDYEMGLPRMWTQREELFRLTEKNTGPDPVRIKKEWGMRLDLSKPVLLEKSPSNSARVRWLNHHFRPACFIAIIRNGYAVAEGIRRKADPKHLRDGWPIEMAAYQWKRTYEVLESDSVYLNRFLLIKYEDLVREPVNELNRITDFIGIKPFSKFNDLMNVSIHERNEPIKDLNPYSISRLTPEDINAVNNVAKDTLLRYGYNVIGGDS